MRGSRASAARAQRPVLAVISLGGALGALARYGVLVALPAGGASGFPLATFLVNVVGCVLIGVLMVLITEVWAAHHLLRPFLGVGVLGGFTTFSTYAVDGYGLLHPEPTLTAAGYLLGTVLAALAGVVVGVWLARLTSGGWRR